VTPRRAVPRGSERIAGTEVRGGWGLARRDGNGGDEDDKGDVSDVGEEISAIRTAAQGDGRQRLGIGGAIPFPSVCRLE
jgi:hypothetical protein